MILQVALVAGSVYTCVEISAGVLFLVTRDKQGNGYYPGNGMVSLSHTHSKQQYQRKHKGTQHQDRQTKHKKKKNINTQGYIRERNTRTGKSEGKRKRRGLE